MNDHTSEWANSTALHYHTQPRHFTLSLSTVRIFSRGTVVKAGAERSKL
jgi:hypothetical protein